MSRAPPPLRPMRTPTAPPPPGWRLSRTSLPLYAAAGNLQAMAPNTLGNVGGSQAHLNMQPFLTLSFCIALQGIFPSPT